MLEKTKTYYTKLNGYLNAHKLKVIVICTVGFLLLTGFLFYRRYVYEQITSYYDSGAYTHDEIDEILDYFDKAQSIYGYKDTAVYVSLYGDKIIDRYCSMKEYEKAAFFAENNKHLNKNTLLQKIDAYKLEAERKEKEAYDNSVEGRTERLEKYEKHHGIGGATSSDTIIPEVFDNLFSYDNKLDTVLPTWNKNSVYKNMLREYINERCGTYDFYYVDYSFLKKSNYTINAYDYKRYLENRYSISVDISDVIIYDFNFDMENNGADINGFHTRVGFPLKAVVFNRDGKWFFGDIIINSYNPQDKNASKNLGSYLFPNDNSYNGLIDER